MSKTHRSWLAWLALSVVAVCTVSMGIEAALLLGAEAAAEAPADADTAAIDIYARPDGETFFALKLTPAIQAPEAGPRDVMILFDTSASQTGAYRASALEALESLLASLGPRDRAMLIAVDLRPVPLTSSMVAPDSDAMTKGLADLRRRVPLGSTDMEAAMAAVVNGFAQHESSAARAAIYIGDGMSTANLIGSGRMQRVVDDLVAAQVPVSSYAVGPRRDNQLLGALANHTGGMLAIDNNEIPGNEVGFWLADAARGPVVWPTSVDYPQAFTEVYPRNTPPLRFDRDTIVLGTMAADAPKDDLAVHMHAQSAGEEIELDWQVAASRPSDDHAYLNEVVEFARADEGVGLPTVGSVGLAEVHWLMNAQSKNLTRLSEQALATGNPEQAEHLAAEAGRLDPLNVQAENLRGAAGNARRNGRGPRDLTLTNFQDPEQDSETVSPPADPIPADLPLEAPPEGSLLDEIEREQRVFTDLVTAEVRNAINEARAMLGTDPEQAINLLKLVLERVEQAPELDPDIRNTLIDQVQVALRTANRQAEIKIEQDIRRQQLAAEAEARERIHRDLFIVEQKVDQLMVRFNALLDEERYRDAEAVAKMAEEMDPGTAGLRSAELTARMVGYRADMDAIRDARHKGVVDSMYAVELSHVPTPDEPPILYPDPEIWQLLTERRKKYKSVDLTQPNTSEARIIGALDEPTELDFVDQPLTDVVDYLKTRHEIEIQLDNAALTEAGVGSDTPVTVSLSGITLRSALRLLLNEHDLTYVIRDEVLMITSKTEAEGLLTTKVYPVADLVMPIPQGGFGGMMGGGMMGGGMGGGGMGGGGMGGGGMGGGGMGGMGGGGGMFAVKDDLKLSSKKGSDGRAASDSKAASKARRGASKKGARKTGSAKAAPSKPVAAVPAPSRADSQPIQITFNEGDDPQTAWSEYFAANANVEPAAIRASARELMNARRFDHVIALINAALANQQGQPWMYEALGLALEAEGRPAEDIERALMSALDFTTDPTDMMFIAHYMARIGLDERALSLFRQVSTIEPTSPEPYAHGLRLAQRLDDLDGMRWATVGVLSQAWPNDLVGIWQSAYHHAEATLDRLRSENRKTEAQAYKAELDEALVRDCVVVVSWTGDADVDLLVEEPSGTVCSFRNPRTTSGGVMLDDLDTRTSEAGGHSADAMASEVYVCPQGFDGTYRLLLRRVWGKLTNDKVTVDIHWYYNSKEHRTQRKQIDLGDEAAVATFDLEQGRRDEPIAQEQVANAVAGQVEIGRQILAQQLGLLNDPRALGSFLSGPGRLAQNGDNNPFGLRGAVGYQPVIITLPKGGLMAATAVVSADRRYVRVTPTPLFSGVSEVNTFNFATGASGTSGGAGGGGFGAGGGGGGLGGFGGGGGGGGF